MNCVLVTLGFACLWAAVPSSAMYRLPHWDPSTSSTGPYNPGPPPSMPYARVARDTEDIYQLGYYEQADEPLHEESRLRRSPGRQYDPRDIGAYGHFNPKAGGPRLPTRFRRELTVDDVVESRLRRSPGRQYDPRDIGAYGHFNPKAGGPRLPTRFRRELTVDEIDEMRVRRQIDGRPRNTGQIPRNGGLNFGHRF